MCRGASHEPHLVLHGHEPVAVVGADMGNLTIASVVVALLSLLGNAGQAWLYLGLRDELTLAKTATGAREKERDTVQQEASACSDAVDDLRTLADLRAKDATTARATAAAQARMAAQRADAMLAAPAAVPGDDCASAQVRVQSWLQTRSSYAP